ncbi:MAG: hypothetical protein WD079_03310 [Phycisphaeraceae bacterium]
MVPAMLLAVLWGCEDDVALTVPTAEEIEERYSYGGNWSAEMSGNVGVLLITRTPQEVRSEGGTWLKATPYIFIFSRETQELFEEFPGLAAVRAVLLTTTGDTVARAMLPRDTLNELTWRRALNVSGLARRDATEEPGRMVDLVRYGEDNTEFEYNRDFIR